MICYLWPLGSVAQEGMPLFTSLLVMYQNSSPSLADWAFPVAKAGMFPDPSASSPWHLAQRR